jgi:regulatory protein
VAKKPEISLRARAMRYLARRDHSRTELQSKLLPHVQDGDELATVLDDLVTCGWLSDTRTASQLVHAKRNRFGTQRIVHELRQKGIPQNLIDEALPELKQSELNTAIVVWQRKFGNIAQDEKEKGKQMRFMQSRGFSIDIILKVLRQN